MGDKAIATTSSCVRGNFEIKKYGTHASIKYKLNCQWDRANIDDWYSVCLTVEYLPRNRVKNNLCFLEHFFLLCWILSIRPSLLAALHFGIASLRYPHHLSVCCMPLYGTWRYIDEGNLPCRLVKLSNCAKILLDRHTRACYSQTFHMLKLLKLRFC